jgi:chemotaxis protein CheZ
MPEQRRIFHIEELMAERRAGYSPAPDAEMAQHHAEIMAELKALRESFAARGPAPATAAATAATQAPLSEARRLKIELDVIGEAIKQTKEEIVTLQDQGFDNCRITRVAGELEAVVDSAERATDQILKSAEQIDEAARNLSALLRGAFEKDLAQDILERVTQIFEACNFQDLTGQRISKVVSTLAMVEDHLARMTEIWSVIERFNAQAIVPAPGGGELLNGPKLEGDAGHSSQDDIDKLFH